MKEYISQLVGRVRGGGSTCTPRYSSKPTFSNKIVDAFNISFGTIANSVE